MVTLPNALLWWRWHTISYLTGLHFRLWVNTDRIVFSDYRLELNQYLQSNGGADRLRWKVVKEGPDDSPTWTADAIRK